MAALWDQAPNDVHFPQRKTNHLNNSGELPRSQERGFLDQKDPPFMLNVVDVNQPWPRHIIMNLQKSWAKKIWRASRESTHGTHTGSVVRFTSEFSTVARTVQEHIRDPAGFLLCNSTRPAVTLVQGQTSSDVQGFEMCFLSRGWAGNRELVRLKHKHERQGNHRVWEIDLTWETHKGNP